ncbi:MAG: DUF444 family protein [Desulfobacteraceae bacterium]|nr:MAG: DUF444 family protein [Desulfobacteraceae bacterium]
MNPKKPYRITGQIGEGLSLEQERRRLLELNGGGSHDPDPPPEKTLEIKGIYEQSDMFSLQMTASLGNSYHTRLSSIDELLERDNQREKDGFPRKIRMGRLIKPGKDASEKIVVVPTTIEEKLIHDRGEEDSSQEGGGGSTGGAGDGEEGEVIGRQPIRGQDSGGAQGPGQGEGAAHELESNAYDIGRILTEKFKLPNLKKKGNKRSLTHFTYDLTDRNEGSGQFLDKKATIRKILTTNIALGNASEAEPIDTSRFLISPTDMVYRVLSREKDYESQALVFFVRDYSGSMLGKTTELIVAQHVLIYSWLLYQYSRQVETRFILHDTEATEVPDFYTYYNSNVAGGTKIAAAYRLVNEIVRRDNLAADYNIYLFHGTDGDDWDTTGRDSIPELKTMLTYANRVGITIAEHAGGARSQTEVERYLKNSDLLNQKPDLIRLDIFQDDADEKRLIDGIKLLTSE